MKVCFVKEFSEMEKLKNIEQQRTENHGYSLWFPDGLCKILTMNEYMGLLKINKNKSIIRIEVTC